MSRYSQLKQKLLSTNNMANSNNNMAKISININNTNEIISPYAEDNKEVINSEFASFLDNSVKDVSPKQDLTLEISANNCDLNKISTAIKNYYFNEFIDSQRKLKRNLVFSICTLIIGLMALALTIVFNSLNTPLIVGAIDIFAWVFMWEAFDLFFFRRAELKYHQYRQMNFINAIITKK